MAVQPTPTLEYVPLSSFGLDRAAELLTRAFADYFVKISFTAAGLLQLARTESVDLPASRIIVRDGAAIGGALIARRGWTSRLAGMALLPDARRKGIARALMSRLLEEAKTRNERTMELEVIEQNEPAVKLYRDCGFKQVRRLVGFSGRVDEHRLPAETIEEVDLRAVGAAIIRNGVHHLPWQLSGETIAQLTPPSIGYRLENAWIALSNLSGPQVVIRALLTESDRPSDLATRLLRAAMAKHPGKDWRMTAIWPEENDGVFRNVGLTPLPLSQSQMKRELI